MGPSTSYLVCASPRSGSTLLCELLKTPASQVGRRSTSRPGTRPDCHGTPATTWPGFREPAPASATPRSFGGGRAFDQLVSHIDIYPTICELAGIERPDFLQGCSLLSLADGRRPAVRDEVFAELTYHAAYEPTRGVRTDHFKYIRRFDDYPYPVLPNCDDSPSKDAFLERGWAQHPVPRELLHDLFFDPGEGHNLIDAPAYAQVAADLRGRLRRWMEETGDPLLEGPVPAPPGARINAQDQRSAADPTFEVEARAAATGP